MNITSLPAIVAVVYLIAYILKTSIMSEKFSKFIPCICGTVGALISVILFYATPDYLCAQNILEAIAIGIVSGFAATGVNQIYKQFSKEEEKEPQSLYVNDDEDEEHDA